MSWRATLITFFCVMAPAFLGPFASAQDDRNGPIFAITEENDIFSNPLTADHTDRHYTQGLKFTYLGGDNDVPGWAATISDALPRWAIHTNAENLGYVFGQNMYTPENLLAIGPIKTDRPYGGWLYGGVYLQRRGKTDADGLPVQEDLELDLGVTGRASLAATVQSSFHGIFDRTEIPEGWNNQVPTEPGLLLKYERLWRLSLNPQTARYVDFIPHAGIELGNIQVSGNLGGTVRVGVNLPEDFGVQIIDSPASAGGGMNSATRPFSFYAFGGADGRAVGHNIFLDGSTFRDGPSVERIPWVADLSCGVAMSFFRHVQFSYTRVLRTHEFVGQYRADVFGSLEAKAMFRF